MNYYKPTNLFEKILKVARLHFALWRAKAMRRPQASIVKTPAVLMVVPQLYRIGGLEKQALQLSRQLVDMEHFVHLVTDQFSKESKDSRQIQNGFLISTFANRSKSRLFTLLAFLNFIFRRRTRYQIIHCHGVSGLQILAVRLAAFFHIPSVIKPATKDDIKRIFFIESTKHLLYRRWLKRATAFIAISREMAQEMLECGIPQNRIYSISNGVDTELFAPCKKRREEIRAEFGVANDVTVFLHLARLESRKGTSLLLQAWNQQSPGLLWIVGDGPEKEKLTQTVLRLSLRNVTFFDSTPSPQRFFQAADVFVLPSQKEGFPGALLEAMSCGLPCIATKIGGVVDIIQHQVNGLLIDSTSVRQLAAALRTMAECKEERNQIAEKGMEFVRSNFDLKIIAARYVMLYRELLNRRLED